MNKEVIHALNETNEALALAERMFKIAFRGMNAKERSQWQPFKLALFDTRTQWRGAAMRTGAHDKW